MSHHNTGAPCALAVAALRRGVGGAGHLGPPMDGVDGGVRCRLRRACGEQHAAGPPHLCSATSTRKIDPGWGKRLGREPSVGGSPRRARLTRTLCRG